MSLLGFGRKPGWGVPYRADHTGSRSRPPGNRAKAARLLRTTERIINYKVRKYAIDTDRFRN